jgi:hypothetical protein
MEEDYEWYVALLGFYINASIPLCSDYNYVREDDKCVPAGPEPIPAGVCTDSSQTYLGSSGYRRIPGNTCDRDKGLKLDEQKQKPCSQGRFPLRVPVDFLIFTIPTAQPAEGEVTHQTVSLLIDADFSFLLTLLFQFVFPAGITQYAFFRDSTVSCD